MTIDSDHKTKEQLLNAIDYLFQGIDGAKIDSTLINNDSRKLTTIILNTLKDHENTKKDSVKNFYKRQLINIYPISTKEYFISIAYVGSGHTELPVLKTVFNLVARNDDGKFVFSIPTNYLTKAWKTKKVGNITYHFADNLDIKNAKIFDKKNHY